MCNLEMFNVKFEEVYNAGSGDDLLLLGVAIIIFRWESRKFINDGSHVDLLLLGVTLIICHCEKLLLLGFKYN